MLLDLNKQFVNLEGKEMEGQTMGNILAQVIYDNYKGLPALTVVSWCMDLYKNLPIEISDEDLVTLKATLPAFLDNVKNLPNSLIVQLVNALHAEVEEIKPVEPVAE